MPIEVMANKKQQASVLMMSNLEVKAPKAPDTFQKKQRMFSKRSIAVGNYDETSILNSESYDDTEKDTPDINKDELKVCGKLMTMLKLDSPDEPILKKNKTRKRNNDAKPKRHRDKTCHNCFVSEKMFELQKTQPELTGRERFREVNRLWKELPSDVKEAMVLEFKAEQLRMKTVME